MSKFSEFCDAHFKKYFELHPTDAIYYGIDGYDHLLNDYSDETYQAEKAFVEESLAKLRQVSAANLDPDDAIDYALLEGKLTIQAYEQAKEDYRLKWPDTYSPIDAIYILTVRTTGDLAGNLLSRLNRTPAVIRQGIANLSRTDANPPRLWTENAIEGAKGGVSFLDNMPAHPKVQSALKDPAGLHAAIETAKSSLYRLRDVSRTRFVAAQPRRLCRRRSALQPFAEEKALSRSRRRKLARTRREFVRQNQARA